MTGPMDTPSSPAPVAVRDRLIRRHWKPRRIRITAVAALLAGFGYLVWRLLGSRNGANPWLFWLLWGAETFGWLGLVLHTHEAWRLTRSVRLPALEVPVDVLITTYNEAPIVLEATLVGCSAIRGRVRVWVLDDGRRAEVQELASSFGFEYVTRPDNSHAKAGNINHALGLLEGELMLVLDADHVPAPDIVEAMSGYFSDPSVALVQSPHFFRNRDSAQHSSAENHEQGLFFEVLLPGRERLDGVFWAGSGALIRTAALRAIGGLRTRTITEDLETSMALRRAGYRIRYHHEHLLHGLAPHNLAAYLIQRDRWARGTLQVLFGPDSPIFTRGWSLRTRIAFLSNLSYYVMPIQRLIFAGVLLTVLVTGVLPVGPIPITMFIAWALWTLSSMAASWGLSRRYQLPLEGDLYTWVTAAPYLNAWFALITKRSIRFRVTPKEGIDEGGREALRLLWLPAVMLAAVVLALFVRISVQVIGMATGQWMLPELTPVVLSAVVFFSLWEAATLVRTLRRFMRRRQYRGLWRFPVDLNATLAGEPARVVDLHEAGGRLMVDANTDLSGDLPLAVQLHTADGMTTAFGTFSARARTSTAEQGLAVGGVIEWSSQASRRAVIFEAYVYAPLLAGRVLESEVAALDA